MKYFAAITTVICGKKFSAGDELTGIPEHKIPNLLRIGHAVAEQPTEGGDEPKSKKPKAAKAE
jgi:hypothetical protein